MSANEENAVSVALEALREMCAAMGTVADVFEAAARRAGPPIRLGDPDVENLRLALSQVDALIAKAEAAADTAATHEDAPHEFRLVLVKMRSEVRRLKDAAKHLNAKMDPVRRPARDPLSGPSAAFMNRSGG
jgi:hypothetical protein